MIPTSASTGAKEEGFRSRMYQLPLSIPARLSTHAVTVVPILAPNMMAMAWGRPMSPALVKLTAIQIVALLLWSTAVVTAPAATPNRVFRVTAPSTYLSRSPAAFLSPSLIPFIP